MENKKETVNVFGLKLNSEKYCILMMLYLASLIGSFSNMLLTHNDNKYCVIWMSLNLFLLFGYKIYKLDKYIKSNYKKI